MNEDSCDECTCVDCSVEREVTLNEFSDVMETRICVVHFEEDCLTCADPSRYDC